MSSSSSLPSPSPSSSSSSNERWNHDVFLSFRGPDTRNTFTAHLYKALRHKGVNVFIDNELLRGEVITSQLLRVIEESRISIILLSEKYASSSFCLDELVKILECKVSKGQTVFPVFYHVDPTDVEEQTGTFGQQFARAHLNDHLNHWKLFPAKAASFLRYVLTNVMWPIVHDLVEERNNDEEATAHMDMVQKWRLALIEVARLSGWHLNKGDDESDIIQDIVRKVSKKLDYTPLHVAKHLVGLASRVEYILQKLNMESHDVCMIGLHGMGGVGKTTTAAALYNKCASQFEFEGSCFLSNVGEESKKHCIAKLQQTLLSEILGDQVHIMENSKKGIEQIKRRLRNKKVLIVIDDVDNLEQLQQLAGELEWFGAGSRIIITTRDLRLLEQHEVTMIYEIEKLEDDLAIELLSWHAFKEPQPREAYLELSDRAIRYAQGLPLALQVLGSSLYKRSVPWWEGILKKLEQCRDDEINKKIFNVLKVSYDSLDSEEKLIFLDIAVFFKSYYKDEIIKFLDECGFSGCVGVGRLIEKSLVYDSYGRLGMHDLLQEMGKQIALENSSRLCIRKGEDIPGLFLEDKIPHSVEGILVDLRGDEEVTLNLLEFTKLRILVIRNGRLTEVPKLPNNIRWLEWHHCSFQSVTLEFLPAELLVLEMPRSSIVHFSKGSSFEWKEKNFLNLKLMNLSSCKYLREIVDFPALPNLEEMNLRKCQNLEKIDVSIGNLKNLKKLILRKCCSLASLPNLVENQRLESLDIVGCHYLKNLPNLPTSLIFLLMSSSGIKEIPSFIENLINLKYMDASFCRNLICVSSSIYKLPYIKYLTLKYRPNFHESIAYERKEYLLDLSGNEFVFLPTINAFKFIHMKELALNNCQLLVEIPELPHTLRFLWARNCKSLVRFSQFQFDDFAGNFSNCHKLAENEVQSWREMLQNLSLTTMEEDDLRRYCSIILPGNEIPEWFSYEGNNPSFKLPSSLLNDDLIAIVWCAVFREPVEVKFSMNEFTSHTRQKKRIHQQ